MILDIFKNYLKKKLNFPSIELSLERISKLGYNPKVVYDIGAYHGEFAKFCLNNFKPSPKVICFEPQESCRKHLDVMVNQGKIEYISSLVGSKDIAEIDFYENETGSSVLKDGNSNRESKKKSVSRIDSLINNGTIKDKPDFVKIDTQGYELEILNGLGNYLNDARMILLELNFIDIYHNAPLMAEVNQFLFDSGFVAYEICSLIRRPLDHALWQSDFIYIKKSDELRSSKLWNK